MKSFNQVSIVGASCQSGQSKSGTELTYQWFKQLEIFKNFSAGKFEFCGEVGENLEPATPAIDIPRWKNICSEKLISNICFNHELSLLVRQEMQRQNFCLNVGGDHSLAIGSISGALAVYPDLKVIWIDAHADINTMASSDSGNIHGMPVSFLTNYQIPKNLKDIMPWLKVLKPQSIVQIGLRDLDPDEPHILKDLGIKYYTNKDVERLGIQQVFKETCQHLKLDAQTPVHCSLDVDGMDPSFFPSTGTPVDDGMDVNSVEYILQKLVELGNFVSMDFVEVNPNLGSTVDKATTMKNSHRLLKTLDHLSFNHTLPKQPTEFSCM